MRNVEKDWCFSLREDRNSWVIIAKRSSRPRDLQTVAEPFIAMAYRIVEAITMLCKTIDKGQFQCIADDGPPFTFGSCAFRFATAGPACRQDFTFSSSSTCFSFSFSWRWFQCKRAVRLIHLRICPIQAKKAHNCYPCNLIRQKSGQPICLMTLKTSTRVYENWAPTFPQCTN